MCSRSRRSRRSRRCPCSAGSRSRRAGVAALEPPPPLPARPVVVSAVPAQDARERPAGARRAAPRAAVGELPAARARRRDAGAGRQARRRELRRRAAQSGHDDASRRRRSPTAIDSAGGIIGVGSGNELTFVNGAVIKDQTDLVLGLASDMVQHPAFAPEEIDRQRRQMLSALQVSYDDPGLHRESRVRPARVRLPSVRPAERRHAGVDRPDHARRPRRVSPHVVRAEQRAARRSSAT